mmetsp:Transcript_7288/g.20540  ORF Transcript_7288/g.20540 Transcript_7288/m.20540 type:complete len:219 (+) Transcript_7288:786-1442(+)
MERAAPNSSRVCSPCLLAQWSSMPALDPALASAPFSSAWQLWRGTTSLLRRARACSCWTGAKRFSRLVKRTHAKISPLAWTCPSTVRTPHRHLSRRSRSTRRFFTKPSNTFPSPAPCLNCSQKCFVCFAPVALLPSASPLQWPCWSCSTFKQVSSRASTEQSAQTKWQRPPRRLDSNVLKCTWQSPIQMRILQFHSLAPCCSWSNPHDTALTAEGHLV